jgi:putative copper export protein
MIESLSQLLRQPEYLHVLLHPLPIWGVGAGAFGLAIALFLRSRSAAIATLAIVLVSAVGGVPVFLLGGAAEPRVEGIIDEAGRAWLEEHERRAEQVIYVYYALALLSAVALIVPAKWPRLSSPLAIAVLVLSIVTLALGGHVAKAGGQIRHREFRTGPLPGDRG